jgi:hypothetical protein
MAQQVSTNKFATAKWIVAPTLDEGATHTTISSAITDASSGDIIFIKPGTYTEDLTLKAGVDLTAFSTSMTNPSIVGKITCDLASNESCILSELRIETNGDYAISFIGSNTNFLTIKNCRLFGSDNDIIQYTNSNSSSILNIFESTVDPSGAYKPFDMSSIGFLQFRYCHHSNNGGSTTAATSSAGTVRMDYCECRWPITTSGTNSFEATDCFFRLDAINATSLTLGGSGDNIIEGCHFRTGTASAISVGGTATISNTDVSSTNTNPITGAGTLNYSSISYSNTGNDTNTTTQSGTFTDLGQFKARSQPCFHAYLNSTVSNVTGDGTAYDIVFNAERFDLGSDFNTGTGIFTAPVDGKYLLTFTVRFEGLTILHTRNTTTIVTSNWNYELNSQDASARDNLNLLELNGSMIVDMDASDTALIRVASVNSTKVVDIGGNGTLTITGFSGELLA